MSSMNNSDDDADVVFDIGLAEFSRADPTKELELIELLGVGSYGKVWKATHLPSSHVVAVKQVPIDDDLDELVKEIRHMKQCRSPYIVSYFGSYLYNSDELWIVMEICEVGSVMDVMENVGHWLDEDQIAVVTRQAMKGLAYLHSVRKIHRDIKGANLLILTSGRVKLADFGVTGQLSDTMNKRNTVIGTPYWMSPEVILEEGHDVKADIWSMAVTVIEMAEGKPPLFSLNPMRAIFVIPTQPPPELKEPERWSEALRSFLADSLVKNPVERPSAADLLGHQFLQGTKPASFLVRLIEENEAALAARGGRAKPGDESSDYLSSSSVSGDMSSSSLSDSGDGDMLASSSLSQTDETGDEGSSDADERPPEALAEARRRRAARAARRKARSNEQRRAAGGAQLDEDDDLELSFEGDDDDEVLMHDAGEVMLVKDGTLPKPAASVLLSQKAVAAISQAALQVGQAVVSSASRPGLLTRESQAIEMVQGGLSDDDKFSAVGSDDDDNELRVYEVDDVEHVEVVEEKPVRLTKRKKSTRRSNLTSSSGSTGGGVTGGGSPVSTLTTIADDGEGDEGSGGAAVPGPAPGTTPSATNHKYAGQFPFAYRPAVARCPAGNLGSSSGLASSPWLAMEPMIGTRRLLPADLGQLTGDQLVSLLRQLDADEENDVELIRSRFSHQQEIIIAKMIKPF